MPIGSRITNGSLNATYCGRQASSYSADVGVNRRANTISFTAPATISDSGNGFNAFRVGDEIVVIGSPANSRVFTLTAATASTLTVNPPMVATEAAGSTIILARN
jgi:hypothetical protein